MKRRVNPESSVSSRSGKTRRMRLFTRFATNARRRAKRYEAEGEKLLAAGLATEARIQFERALSAMNEAIDQRRHARIYYWIGRALETDKQYQQALVYYQLSLETAEEQNNTHQQVDTYIRMGRCESERQNYQRGLTSFAAALKLLYHQQRPETIAEVYHEIGDTYVAMGDWLQAASLLQTALESSSPTALAFHEPYMRRNLAKAFGMLNQWNQALHHASWAATAFEGRGKHEELGSLYDQIGQAYTHLRDYDDAEQALDNAWYWKEKTQQRGLLWYTRYLEARLYERQNRRLDAKRAYKEADDLLNEANEELSQRFERAIEGLDTWLYERFGSNRTNPTTEEPNAAPAASTQEITD